MTTKILLVDDHHLIRQGVRALLESEGGFEVVGEAGDGPQALRSIVNLRPHVAIVDVVLPGINGIEVARQIKHRLPTCKVVMLSMYDSAGYVFDALQAGASGYVLKMSTAEVLVFAIHEALAGRTYLSPPLDEMDFTTYARRQEDIPDEDPYDVLTEREQQVFLMAAKGASNPEIAVLLQLSVRTVEMHRANMLKKLNLKSQTELVRYAIKRGLVD